MPNDNFNRLVVLYAHYVSFALLFPALGITELVIAVQSKDHYCDKPIVNWLYAIGVFHLVTFLLVCCLYIPPQFKFHVFPVFLVDLGSLIFLVLAFIYGLDTKSCDPLLAGYIWWFAILSLPVAAFLSCCGCVVGVVEFINVWSIEEKEYGRRAAANY